MFQGNIEYYVEEIEINGKFRIFVKNVVIVFVGYNMVIVQLKIKSVRGIYCKYVFFCNIRVSIQRKIFKKNICCFGIFFF